MTKRLSGAGFLFVLALVGFVSAAPAPAHAQFEYCNQTSFFLFTSVAYERDNGSVRTEGWWLVRPGECRTVISRPLRGTTYYTYAESHPAHIGGIRTWGGRSRFCAGDGLYTIDSHEDCFESGFEPREFARISIGGETEWTANLTEPSNYQREAARHAGAQRLLNDIGYEAGVVDGYLGRQTRRSITRFKRDYGVDDRTIVSNALLDELVAQAAEVQQETGYQFCNNTDMELWAAMGFAQGTEWHSSGWWSLAPDTCAKTVNDDLPAELIYTYAVGYTENGETIEWGGDYPLCTGDQRFEIAGNDDCESRGYMTVGFQRIPTEGRNGWSQSFVMDASGQPTQETIENPRPVLDPRMGAPAVPAPTEVLEDTETQNLGE